MRNGTARLWKKIGLIGPSMLVLVACEGFLAFVYVFIVFFAGVFVATNPEASHLKTSGNEAITRSADWTYLGAAAHLTGAADTNWRSDVELHNASHEAATVTIELLDHGKNNSSPESAEFFLGPRRSLLLSDVLATSFTDTEKAALRLRTTGGAVMATDRTYNLLDEDNTLGLPPGATFGQYIPLQNMRSAFSNIDEGRLIGLTHDETARTNLGLVNLTPIETRVRTELFLADGTALGTFQTRLEPYEYRQINRVFERATSAPVADGYLVVSGLTEGGSCLAHASVVDSVTGDPVFVPAVRMTTPAGQTPPVIVIVASAHVSGAAGTNWRTDLEIHNPNDTPVDFAVELLELNSNNLSPRTETGTLAGQSAVRYEDVLQDLFGFDGAAALRIVPDGGRLIATSRTFNQLTAGNPHGLPPGASFGQFIPGVEPSAAITPDSEGRMVHLAYDPTGERGFRTNLVLVNATADRTPVRVELFSADATPLGTIDFNLRAFEYKQINNVFSRVTDQAVQDGYAVVRVRKDEGAAFALASVVDNLTGDPVGMMATIVRTADAAAMVDNVSGLMGIMGGVGVERPVSIEGLIGELQQIGVDGLVDIAADAYPPGVATEEGGVITADFGSGTRFDNVTLAGSSTLDFSGLVVDESGVRGEIVEVFDGYTVNGEAPPIDGVQVSVDLEARNDGTIAGTIGLSESPMRKSTGATLTGAVGIDTGICLTYPISGEITFTSPDGEVITVTFGPDCDGSFTTDIEPAWDWEYRFQSPMTDWAQVYVASSHNARVFRDVADYWIPNTGGTEFYGRENPGDTPAGIITYRFPFANPTTAARIRTDTATFNFESSKGHNYLLASADGVDWVLLNEVPPPENPGDPPRNGYFDGILPPGAIGTTEIWIRVELYAYGTATANGFTNTAQHARFWESGARDTFILEVACVDGNCIE
ncbi:MAG: hypothetical protein V2I67_17965 [Thermoanaerobaculales bacterium]|jgi:hypothetical protein|nr:hypothetical protein [Thermoanaerobaculales bacterium]